MDSIIKFNQSYIKGYSSIGGKTETEGPLGKYFDLVENDMRSGEESWEMAESELSRLCIEMLINKYNAKDVSLITGGDLLNQCVASAFAVSGMKIPYLGLYGACSTCAEGLIVGALMCEKMKNDVISFASSHFCAAEKQYRFPLEYGGQRPPTSQTTVTGCGSFLITGEKSGIKISEGLIGRVNDAGISDANNMGAAMAVSAADTLKRYFDITKTKPDDFDLIATGDLGIEGFELTKQLLLEENIVLGDVYKDCGLMIYDIEKQDVHSGGSGCGCSALVTASRLCPLIEQGELENVLLVGTGALLSKTTAFQGKNIPSVAHLVRLERVK